MNYEKLKRMAILIVAILLVVLIATNCEMKEDYEKQINDGKEQQNISTEVPFDVTQIEDDNMVRDYTNPTEEEEMEAYKRYGKDGCYFDEKGLHIKNEDGSQILVTQLLLEDNEFLKTLPDIDVNKIDYFEYENNAVIVYFRKMTKKEFESYLKAIKKDYKYPVTIKETNVEYKADCAEGHRVTVSYNEGTEKAAFKFKRYHP